MTSDDPAVEVLQLRQLVSLGCRVLGQADQGDLIWGTSRPATRAGEVCG